MRTINLSAGAHETPDDGTCVMEAAALICGRPHSDHDDCICPVLGEFCRAWHDSLPSDAERNRWLMEFVFRLPDTRSPEHEQQRMYIMADWSVRECAPLALDAAGLADEAERLRHLSEVVDAETASAASAAWAANADAQQSVWDVALTALDRALEV